MTPLWHATSPVTWRCFLGTPSRLSGGRELVRVSQERNYVDQMPRLSEFYGIAIYMYFGDDNPPHFHAIYAEHEALVRIDNGSLLCGELPRTAARLVEQWRELHQDELMKNWRLAQEPAALSAIEPLQ